MTGASDIRLLIVGTGSMAAKHAEAFGAIAGVRLAAAVDTNAERLSAFTDRHRIPARFATVEDALAAGGFEAASNVTPDPAHLPTTLPLLAAGIHVFCEKPLAVTQADAERMAQAAARAGVVHGINLTYRNVPALQHAHALIADGRIGTVRHLEASYLQSWLTQPAWGDWRNMDTWLWRLSTAHGSKGVLGDVGIHILDFLSFAADADVAEIGCRLVTFDKAPGGKIGPYRLDANDSAAMTLRLANGALGVCHASRFATGHLNDLRARIYGERGGIEVAWEGNISRIRISEGPDLADGIWRELAAPPVPTTYERFIAAIRGEAPMDPDFHRGAALQAVLDRAEESDAQGGRTLAV